MMDEKKGQTQNKEMYSKGDIIEARYEILGTIGKGGMGSVYKARDLIPNPNRYVAIKSIFPNVMAKETGSIRYETEKEAFARSFDNRNVVGLYDIIQTPYSWLLVLELIEGGTLKSRFTSFGYMTNLELKYFFIEILEGLKKIHELGIVHRDIKPDNIMLTHSGDIKVGDFGISLMSDIINPEAKKAMGTPKYMAPEQSLSMAMTKQIDLYAVGIMLYEFATGVAPYVERTPMKTATKHINSAPISPRSLNPNLSQSLENIILKAIAKNPKKRYQNAQEMIDDLNNFEKNQNAKPIKYDKKFVIKKDDGKTETYKTTSVEGGLHKYLTSPWIICFWVLLLFLVAGLIIFMVL